MCEKVVCVYCLEASSNTNNLEHVTPESLGCKDTLPKGTVCDSCNDYFSNMDKNVLYNRYISLHVGTAEIPGKKDKIRKQLGENLFFPKKGEFQVVLRGTIPAGEIQPGTEFEFKLEQSKEFDELLFARGIHKIAFNCYAHKFGQSNALQNRFDKLRRYIRYAKTNELWTYGVRDSRSTANRSCSALCETDWGPFLGLRLLSLDFFVSLTGWRSEIESGVIENGYDIIRRKGQWQESSLLGLKK